MKRVFVYGTLMKGYGNHRVFLEGKARQCGRGIIKGELFHLPEGYPGLLKGEGPVRGEVYEIRDENVLKSLDGLEGYEEGGSGNLYERARETVTMEGEETLECWVYYYRDGDYARSRGVFVENGDWKAFMERRGEQ